MTRAFDREPDGVDDALPDIPLSEHPNYITPRGLARLRARREAVQAQLASLEAADKEPPREAEQALLDRAFPERELRWLDHRLGSAIEVDLLQQPRDQVAFGATVTVDSSDGERRWQIVGEDEADAEHGRVSYLSPLAQALLGTRIGDEVIWPRPAGDLPIEVVAIDYLEEDAPG
jgi:transcription elongation GreA/GreB family factor